MNSNGHVLQIENLETHFFLDEGVLRAVGGVSLEISKHKTLGLIGESGCGKSVMAQSILQIVPEPGKIVEGSIRLSRDGTGETDIVSLNPAGEEIQKIRGGSISMIFQEPMTSLSPVHTIEDQLTEMLLRHTTTEMAVARERTIEMLEHVGIPNPLLRMKEYPHELSGGLRQRVMIAMALSCNPLLLIADEPTTALDVTIQAQILELMQRLQEEFGMAILFITHDLGIIAGIADEVAVMYLGKVVERAPVREIFNNPLHPYTCGLLNSVPRLGQRSVGKLETIEGNVPLPIDLPLACGFYSRCSQAQDGQCNRGIPPLIEVEENHHVRCVLFSGGEISDAAQ